MIQFNHVTKRYFTRQAVDDLTFQLPQGKVVGIVGENGSGKSTILKLMAGLIKPTQGTVTIAGQPADRKICRMVSYLSELDAYYPFFTVGDTVDFYNSQFTDFDEKKADDILQFMGLKREDKVKHLSKGNRGRLKMALTLARKVPVILMDEPLSGLDPLVRESIVQGLISFMDLEQQTVVITTHEINEIEPLLDMVILLKRGRLIGMEEAETLRSEQNMGIVEWMKQTYAHHV
jgi:ABC-2 type transport system ATP-binding protein